MDKKFNDLGRDKFRAMIEDVRRKSRAGCDDFRRAFRGNVLGFRENLQKNKSGDKLRGKGDDIREDSGKADFTEDFHERQVDYHKDFRGGEEAA